MATGDWVSLHMLAERTGLAKTTAFKVLLTAGSEYFVAPFPARTTITDCLGSKLRYEIECLAVGKPQQA
jgi:hypothetical protein